MDRLAQPQRPDEAAASRNPYGSIAQPQAVTLHTREAGTNTSSVLQSDRRWVALQRALRQKILRYKDQNEDAAAAERARTTPRGPFRPVHKRANVSSFATQLEARVFASFLSSHALCVNVRAPALHDAFEAGGP